jgi:hypothetical protein
MNLSKACIEILHQLAELVRNIRPEDFSRPSDALNKATIGQHLRHTLEFFICLEDGYEKSVVNYDKRNHNTLMEINKEIALESIGHIIDFVQTIKENKALKLEVGYDLIQDDYIQVETNVIRELIYNIEHAIHHMAIMKIGIREIAPYINLPYNFGIAASTIRYQGARAQSSY